MPRKCETEEFRRAQRSTGQRSQRAGGRSAQANTTGTVGTTPEGATVVNSRNGKSTCRQVDARPTSHRVERLPQVTVWAVRQRESTHYRNRTENGAHAKQPRDEALQPCF